ncbi:hypothetical protein GCK32_012513 [Trichostrongylus colubriformis]|uniref:Uncharacterized protein n=1 Tax=Trichostrongylus colubriformis TaxID=6319 RepID=A0AAN8FV08_TRICO
MVEMSSSCTAEPPIYCSPHASFSSTPSPSTLISMEKHQRHQSTAANTTTNAIDTNDCVLSRRLLDYSPSTTTTLSTASDALRIAHEQLRKVYIAEASLLTNMEQCSNSPDFDHIMDGLRRLAVYEADIQRRLFCHIQLLSS